jgi:hypothetical protein
MYEVNCFDGGEYSFTYDLPTVDIGSRFTCNDGIELEILAIISIDEESRMADIEISYCV